MRNPLRLLLASSNTHKARELSRLLPDCRILLPQDFGIPHDPQETADSFRENALIKALRLATRVGSGAGVDAFVADDSGLCVDALDGRPGVQSNRYGSDGGALLDAEGKIRLLLRELGDRPDRSARFVCALALVFEPERFVVVQETAEGFLRRAPSGTGGFGYDPVFEVPEIGKTMAELSDEQKDRVSHRGRAARWIRLLLQSAFPS
jgi:XTP/dITP diphosphohydrolase